MSDNSNKGEMLQRICDLERKKAELEDKLEKLQCKSINQQASAWSAVYDFVRKYVPEFSMMKGSGKEQVISAIDGLIKRNRELSSLINTHHLVTHDAGVAKQAYLVGFIDGHNQEECLSNPDLEASTKSAEYAAHLRAKAGER